MPRSPQPRYRADRDTWITQINGERFTLAHGKGSKQAAKAELIRLLAERQRPGRRVEDDPLVGEICERRLDWLIEHAKPRTVRGDQWYLDQFTRSCGRLRVSRLKVHCVTDWLRTRPRWSPMTRRRAIAVVKAVFAWARKQGLVSTDPLFALEKPPMSSRPRCSGRAELDQIRPWVRSKEFLAYLEVLAACGCRPSELSRLEARDLRPDLMAGVLDVHKNSGRKQGARVVYFSAAAWKLVEERARLRPTGPLFRTRRDRPWSDSARNTQIRGIRARAKRAGVALPSFNSYSFRHGFITDGLENGATASELAALVGNSSREIDRTYDHLRKRQPAMRAVLDRVRPSE